MNQTSRSKMETTEISVMENSPSATLAKVNVTSAILNALVANYTPLLATPPKTKEERDVIHKAQMECKDWRMKAVAVCTTGREDAIRVQREWIAEEKRVVGIIESIEAPLKKLKEGFDKAEELRFLEVAKEEKRRVDARKERMYAIGFRFDGTKYILEGFAELTENEVSGLGVDDLQLGEWLNETERQVNEHKEREAEKERTAKIAADALAAQQKAEADRQAAVAAEQAAKAKELADKEAAMNARILSARTAELKAVGAIGFPEGLLGMDDAEFAAYVVQAKADAEARALAAKKAEEKAAAERKANEERIAAEAVKRAEAERIAAEAREKEEAAEREAKMSDAAKFRAYHAALMAVKVPEMKSKAGQKLIAEIVTQLGSMVKA